MSSQPPLHLPPSTTPPSPPQHALSALSRQDSCGRAMGVPRHRQGREAWRRWERRRRAWAKHERRSVAMALAETLHHSARKVVEHVSHYSMEVRHPSRTCRWRASRLSPMFTHQERATTRRTHELFPSLMRNPCPNTAKMWSSSSSRIGVPETTQCSQKVNFKGFRINADLSVACKRCCGAR